jgi:thymidylate synthase (FAD)
MNNVRLIAKTEPVLPNIPSSEGIISYCARVSNKSNQDNYETAPKLIRYCVNNAHWSVLEMNNLVIEVTTTRLISAQILRHGFKAQELSQRYTDVSVANLELRAQGSSNRQGSLDESVGEALQDIASEAVDVSYEAYNHLVKNGVALECARSVLPMCSETTVYLNNTLRGWVHYCQVRMDEHTQKEHREIAKQVWTILKEEYPNVIKAIDE